MRDTEQPRAAAAASDGDGVRRRRLKAVLDVQAMLEQGLRADRGQDAGCSTAVVQRLDETVDKLEVAALDLRECADRVPHDVEDLDALRDRAAVTNDELSTRLAELMNRRMYLLSLVAAVFLPLGLLTGLRGINVGGLPGGQNEWGFWIVSALLVILGFVTVWFLRAQRKALLTAPFRIGAQQLVPHDRCFDLADGAAHGAVRNGMAALRTLVDRAGVTSTRRRNLCRSAEQNCALRRKKHSLLQPFRCGAAGKIVADRRPARVMDFILHNSGGCGRIGLGSDHKA